MEYIVHRRFREKAADGVEMNIPYGTKFETIGDWIVTETGRVICAATSETAQEYFARNDDGQGLERGKLTYAIAYAPRRAGNGFRFSDAEIEMLEKRWSHFLRDDVDTILFNEKFFNAQVPELAMLAKALNIKVRR